MSEWRKEIARRIVTNNPEILTFDKLGDLIEQIELEFYYLQNLDYLDRMDKLSDSASSLDKLPWE